MKLATLAVSVASMIAGAACAAEAVQIDITITRGDQVVGHPRVVGKPGQPMTVKVSNAYRFEALVSNPNPAGIASTALTIEMLDGKGARPVPVTFLSKANETTRLSYTAPNSDTRFDIEQRRAEIKP